MNVESEVFQFPREGGRVFTHFFFFFQDEHLLSVGEESSLASVSTLLETLFLTITQLQFFNFPFLKFTSETSGHQATFHNPNKYFHIVQKDDLMRKCAYCRKTYDIRSPQQLCMYHNIPKPNQLGIYRCCGTRDYACKQRDYHCTNDINIDLEVDYILSSECRNTEHEVLVVDCEFTHTIRGSELAGFAIIDWNENIIADFLMQPENVLRERSGRSGRYLSREEYRELLTQILGPNVVLVGHALHNDMLKMKIIHDKIVDTSVLYHKEGADLARKISLDSLVSKHLRHETYNQQILMGSKSLLDAAQTLRLVKKYLNTSQ